MAGHIVGSPATSMSGYVISPDAPKGEGDEIMQIMAEGMGFEPTNGVYPH